MERTENPDGTVTIKIPVDELMGMLAEQTGGFDIFDQPEGYIRFVQYRGYEFMWKRTAEGIECVHSSKI